MSRRISSSKAAGGMLRGSAQDTLASFAWVGGRAILLSAGMYVGGERKNLIGKAICASIGIQGFVTGWAAVFPNEPLPSESAAESGDPLPIVLTALGRAALIYTALRATGNTENIRANSIFGAAAIETVILASPKMLEDT
jgi:hypothetical protein